MARYKPDQGRMARTVIFWSLALFLLFGCTSLNDTLAGRFDSMRAALGGVRVPILGVDLSPAFLISAVIFLGGVFLLFRWLETPRQADFLIDTEHELRKVTWPTAPEVVNSSMVVVVSVLFLMGFLALTDWFLARLTRALLGI